MSFYQDCRPEQKRFYSSKKWIKCRDTYLSEHQICERCAKRGIIVAAEHVHHKRELTAKNYKNPMIAFNPDNLEALCWECHNKEHHSIKEIGEDYFFDADGNIQLLPPEG